MNSVQQAAKRKSTQNMVSVVLESTNISVPAPNWEDPDFYMKESVLYFNFHESLHIYAIRACAFMEWSQRAYVLTCFLPNYLSRHKHTPTCEYNA